MQLSNRLKMVASLVTAGNRVADVGTDHAYIPIYLLESGIAPSVIAMDINKGPLARAKKHIEEHKLSAYIDTRLSDGVSALSKNEADTLIIAGMGGALVIKILTEGKEVLSSLNEFILQPQSELENVRMYLAENHYQIIQEEIVFEDGKYYPMMKVVRGEQTFETPLFLKYGKLLLQKRNETLKRFLEKELLTYLKISEQLKDLNESHILDRKKEIESEIQDIKGALQYYEGKRSD